MIATFWVYLYGYQLDVRFGSFLGCLKLFFSKISQPFPQMSQECALKLTELWLNTRLLLDLNYKFINGSLARF